jgi:hypothetical protein
MSKLSDALHAVANFFAGNAHVTQAVAPVVSNLTAAVQAAEAALPDIADAGANAAMALLGEGGSAFAPLADSYIEALIGNLEGKKSTAQAVAQPAVQAG